MKWAVLTLLTCAAAVAGAAPEPDTCTTSSDCGWDDLCSPSRCGKRVEKTVVGCEKASRPPGECLCNEGLCSLRPSATPEPGGTCTADGDCAVDPATATCQVGGASLGPISVEGPLCRCAAGRCAFEWAAPVTCTTYRDCSWATTPRLRPVSAKATPRPHKKKVRPCKDGERDSVCGEDGVCRIVSWKC